MLHPVNVYNMNSVGAGWRIPTVSLGARLQRGLHGGGFVSWVELAELPDQLFVSIARFESRNFVIHLVLSRVS